MFCATGRSCCARALALARGARPAGGGAGGGGGGGDGDSPLRRLLDGAAAFGEPEAPGEGELRWATQPYARRGGRAAGQPGDAGPARERPEDAVVLLFPGQGAQHVGMGLKLKHLPAARDLYQLASEILGCLNFNRLHRLL